MRSQVEDFLERRIGVAQFLPAYMALFAPFDPPEAHYEDLSKEEDAQVQTFIRIMGGWFGEHALPRDPSWRYGVDVEPYAWIDEEGYRHWIRGVLRRRA